MGSHNFEETIYTNADMDTAYREAVEQARYEFGAEPYNGTISTTAGVRLSPLAANGPTREDQISWESISGRLDHLNKWGECEAIPILRVENARTEELGQMDATMTVPSELLSTAGHGDALSALLTKELRKTARTAGAVQARDWAGKSKTIPLPETPASYQAQFSLARIVQKPRVTTRATTGKTVTRYFILPADNRRQMPAWESGHPTQAAARAALPQDLSSQHVFNGSHTSASWQIIAMTRREDGSPLVTHEVDATAGKTVKATLTGRVQQVLSPSKATGERGWLFYGWAAS